MDIVYRSNNNCNPQTMGAAEYFPTPTWRRQSDSLHVKSIDILIWSVE